PPSPGKGPGMAGGKARAGKGYRIIGDAVAPAITVISPVAAAAVIAGVHLVQVITVIAGRVDSDAEVVAPAERVAKIAGLCSAAQKAKEGDGQCRHCHPGRAFVLHDRYAA